MPATPPRIGRFVEFEFFNVGDDFATYIDCSHFRGPRHTFRDPGGDPVIENLDTVAASVGFSCDIELVIYPRVAIQPHVFAGFEGPHLSEVFAVWFESGKDLVRFSFGEVDALSG